MKDLKSYNEYVRITRDRLRKYNQLRAKVDILNNEIAAMERAIENDVAAPVSRYGDEPGGGSPELNSVEAAANRHMAMRARIAEKRKAISCISLAIQNIDCAVNALNPEDKKLIRGFYFDEQDWGIIADSMGHSYSWASSRGNRALKRVAGMLFADKVAPEQLELDFMFA